LELNGYDTSKMGLQTESREQILEEQKVAAKEEEKEVVA
jgi:hypothetical protein